MPPDTRDAAAAAAAAAPAGNPRYFFSVPAPIKRIFDKFPLTTYPPNDLPRRIAASANENKLYVFIDPAGARHGRPSFNPQCLKWQVRFLPRKLHSQSID